MSSYAENILRSILLEEVNQADVIDAIKKRHSVSITYDADNSSVGHGQRIIQPVAYGKTKAGNLVIRAFQPLGDTKSRVPSWKTFRLDRINDWKPDNSKSFDEPPSNYGLLNPNGDDAMAEVYLVADFGNNDYGDTEANRKEQPIQQAQEPQQAYQPVNNKSNWADKAVDSDSP
jgi:hypothetical protein